MNQSNGKVRMIFPLMNQITHVLTQVMLFSLAWTSGL